MRLFLVGLYSGSRPGVMFKLRWLPSTRRRLGRPGKRDHPPPWRQHQLAQEAGATGSYPSPLLPHLRRWRREDQGRGLTHVIHYEGRPIKKTRFAWETVRRRPAAREKIRPIFCRHSSATMFMSWGLDVAIVAGFLGMSADMLWEVYGHHHPSFQSAVAQSTPGKRANQNRTG